MAVKVGVGGEFFDRLRESGAYYVDKTELLVDLVNQGNSVTLFTRPRRFGKTLTMSMIQNFFDINRDSRAIFKDLAVEEHEEFCREWMNQYPVLSVSLKDAEGLTFQSAYEMLKMTVSNLCHKVVELRESERVAEEDRAFFNRLIGGSATETDVRNSLLILTRMMHAHYGRPVILLIDEYDVPLAKANEVKKGGERYYPQMLEVIRSIMSTALKSNDDLKFAVITGCLRIAKESIFTGVNNFKSYSVLDQGFSTYFGFTDGEVETLLSAAGLADRSDVVKRWYDGYVFGNTKIFCPWDVMNYVADAQFNPAQEPKNYWKNTSGNGIIRDFVERTEFNVKGKFETLMNGGAISQTIEDELTYDTLHETEENLWSVLVMTGYLTKADRKDEGNGVRLKIPNAEIASIFQDTVVRYFTDHLNTDEQKEMMHALWTGDEKTASTVLSRLLMKTISYMDYHENYYHAFLAGIFVGQGYEVYSNRESGTGRPDLVLIDHNNYRVLILETKKSSSKAQMEHDCEEALRQIAGRDYAAEYEDYEEILTYGISFYRKNALVKKS